MIRQMIMTPGRSYTVQRNERLLFPVAVKDMVESLRLAFPKSVSMGIPALDTKTLACEPA